MLKKKIKGNVKNSHGYTLLEMLLVLFVAVTISSLVFQFTIKLTEKRVVEQFVNQILFDLQTAQALAIEERRSVTFVFLNNRTYKAYYELGGDSILERTFPAGIELNKYSTSPFFSVLLLILFIPSIALH